MNWSKKLIISINLSRKRMIVSVLPSIKRWSSLKKWTWISSSMMKMTMKMAELKNWCSINVGST